MSEYDTSVEDGRQAAELKLGATEWLRSVQKLEQEQEHDNRRIRAVNHQVRRLRNELDEDKEECKRLAEETAACRRELSRLQLILAQEKRQKQDAEIMCIHAKRERAARQKENELLRQEIGSFSVRIRHIRADAAKSTFSWQLATLEKKKLALERGWFLRERGLLERTTQLENEKIRRNRKTMAQVTAKFRRAQEFSARAGHLRSERPRPGDDDWYRARTRGRPVPTRLSSLDS